MSLVDEKLGGRTTELIQAWRAEGLSWNEVAYRFRELGIDYTGETWRRRWLTLAAAA